MTNYKTFPFHKARRVTPQELRVFRKAIKNTLGYLPARRGRPLKGKDKYKDIHLKIHPIVLDWAKKTAKKKGIGYQTLLNETLLQHVNRLAA